MESYLIHYRTPGSRNGVRLYQYEDGTLTPLGKRRYLQDEKNNTQYYNPKFKPKFYDLYGKNKQNELNECKKNIGMKSYKGYERAELNDKPEMNPLWNTKKHKKELEENYKKYKESDLYKSQHQPISSQQMISEVSQNPLNKIVTEENVKNSVNFIYDLKDFLNSPIDYLIWKAR